MENPDKGYQVVLDGEANTIIARANPVIPAIGLELFKVGQLCDGFSLLNVLNYYLDLLELGR
jgi:hypothetical protein